MRVAPEHAALRLQSRFIFSLSWRCFWIIYAAVDLLCPETSADPQSPFFNVTHFNLDLAGLRFWPDALINIPQDQLFLLVHP